MPSERPAQVLRAAALPAMALAVLVIAAYLPVLWAGFIWDDDDYVTSNRWVKSADGLLPIWQIVYDDEGGYWRCRTPQYYPLVFTSFWIEHRLWGLHPAGYHVVNVLLHLANALLVWRLGQRLSIPAPWFVAAVFAVHPMHVETVAWITERKNLLSGLFYLVGLLALLRSDRGERAALGFYVAALLAFVAALLSKTVTASLPAAYLLICWWQNRLRARAWLRAAPFFVLGAAFGLFTAYLEVHHVAAAGGDWQLPLHERAAFIVPRAFWFYFGKIAWPDPVMFIYSRWQPAMHDWRSYAAIAALALVIMAGALLWRRGGRLAFACLFFSGLTLAPALGLLNVYPHRYSWVADHFCYLGSLGFIVLLVAAGHALLCTVASRASWSPALAAGVLLALAALSHRHARTFESYESVWLDTLSKNPNAWIASFNLALRAQQRGETEEAERYYAQAAQHEPAAFDANLNWSLLLFSRDRLDESLQRAFTAIAIRPHDARGHSAAGAALAALGRLEPALASLQRAVEIDPALPAAWENLARAQELAGQAPAALVSYARAVELRPDDAALRREFAALLFAFGRWDDAFREFGAASRQPGADWQVWRDWADSLYEVGAYPAALQVAGQGAALTPEQPDIQNSLAWFLATCPHDSLRDPSRALTISGALLRDLPRHPLVLDTHAAALAATGEFEAAAQHAIQAAERAEELGETELAARIRERVQLYRSGQAFVHTRQSR